MTNRTFRIGTRTSTLARWQTDRVVELLKRAVPDIRLEIVDVTTTGDTVTGRPISEIGGQGVFTKEIEQALLDGTIDLAVHSLKDLESVLPDGLVIAAVPEREDVRDVLISDSVTSVEELPENAKVFTGSLRRKAQLLNIRPDLGIEDIRGNVETRLRKFRESGAHALVMASAGIRRLGLGEAIGGHIPVETLLPAVGQGAIAVEIRKDDDEAAELCTAINDETLIYVAAAERSFMRTLQGGCRVPIGGYGTVNGDTLRLRGILASLDGKTLIRKEVYGNILDAEVVGLLLGKEVLEDGGAEILRTFRNGQ